MSTFESELELEFESELEEMYLADFGLGEVFKPRPKVVIPTKSTGLATESHMSREGRS